MFITALEVSDYKRVRKVAIKPDADSCLILVGGKNRQGKSSTLDALTAAFGGAKAIAPDPVRHGAAEAAIFIELDDGNLTIDRVIHPDGKTTLEVRNATGPVRRPQEVLDQLVGARFLDPLEFLRLKAPEQRARLMKLIDASGRIEQLDAKRKTAFDRRTELGRDLTRARGELERLPEVTAIPQPIDVAELLAQRERFGEQQRVGDALGAVARAAELAASAANDRLGNVVLEIQRLNARLAELNEKLPELEADLQAKVDQVAATRNKLQAAATAWAESGPARQELDDQVAELTGVLKTIDDRKAAVLAAAKLPVEGLKIGDDGILIRGDDGIYGPFSEAAASQKWTVAFALAMAGSPGLGDVWLKDGVFLDDESLDAVTKLAAAAGKRVWIERVGTKDPGVIVIQDGQVADAG